MKKPQRRTFFVFIRIMMDGLKQVKSIDAKRIFFLRIHASVSTAEVCGIITPKAADQILRIAEFYKYRRSEDGIHSEDNSEKS